jgi:hypothetical protein
MITSLTTTNITPELADKLMLQGDLSKLNEVERLQYYKAMCDSAGLDWLQRPFDLLTLQGKTVLYANKGATAQLTALHKPSVRIVDRSISGGLVIITAEVTKRDGSCVQDVGVVPFPAIGTDAQANAIMKATTKAKRRAMLSAYGLSMVDESELDTIPQADYEVVPMELPSVDTVVIDTIAALEGCDDRELFITLADTVRKMEQGRKDAIAPTLKATADKLGLAWAGKEGWKEVVA